MGPDQWQFVNRNGLDRYVGFGARNATFASSRSPVLLERADRLEKLARMAARWGTDHLAELRKADPRCRRYHQPDGVSGIR
jgi:hypothetical protein